MVAARHEAGGCLAFEVVKFYIKPNGLVDQTALRGGEMEADRIAAAARKALADGLLTESEAYEFTKES